jgi:hypothetical protein
VDARGIVDTALSAVERLDLLATLPTWTVDGPGPLRDARLAPALGPALPPAPYGYDDYDASFFESFEGADPAEVARAIDASFDAVVMLPPDAPRLGTEADDERVVRVRIGTPIALGARTFLWLARRATHAPGQWVEERYWVCVDARGEPIPSTDRFGYLEPWSRGAWRREGDDG